MIDAAPGACLGDLLKVETPPRADAWGGSRMDSAMNYGSSSKVLGQGLSIAPSTAFEAEVRAVFALAVAKKAGACAASWLPVP